MPRLSRGTIRKTVKGSLVRDAGVESPSAARVLTLVLPMPENIANARMHWRGKLNAKKAYWEVLNALAAFASMRNVTAPIPRPPDAPLARARIASVMHVGARMDADNAMARHKWALDWLQGAGYIANDKHLEWESIPQQIVKRDGDYRLVLTLTEIL